ncbi:MAG: TrkH family potassium uptake protein [Lachnospiraceae bacterium]|nr:TrkH family potassium uptake protein [Lachnospiraceae bacterium]
MNYKMIGKFIGQILMLEAIFMVPALLIGVYFGEVHAVLCFAATMVLTFLVGMALYLFGRGSRSVFRTKEGLVCVGLSWIVMSLLGCLPFYLSGEIPRYIDAFFEIVSGFTTTGASILEDVEALSNSMLYWRSFSHWVGGMGVLVFLLAFMPSREEGGFTTHLLKAESPGPNVGKLVPKMKDTASILYILYCILTLLDFIFLLAGGLDPLSAICIAFGTAGTGGFGVKADSIAGYSPYIQNVCTVFMLLFGVNFSCYYLLTLRKFKDVFRDEELRTYVGIVIGSIALIVWNLRGYYDTLAETVRHAAFQVASIMTTTGFATTDFDLWPNFSKGLLLILMIIGACAGSTGGGFKVGRMLLVIKSARRSIQQVVSPRKVEVVRSNGYKVSEKVVASTNAYLAAYMMIIIGSFLLVSLDGFSITTNLSAVVACFNNIGPGFEMVGATGNYSAFSVFSKLVLILDMLAGRLEIFPILILFSGNTWRRRG